MKNILRFFRIAVVLCFLALFSSCGEKGGIIEVYNSYSGNKEVTVYSGFEYHKTSTPQIKYSSMYGPKYISPGKTEKFDVSSNSEYFIYWLDGSNPQFKPVSVSDGRTVSVMIP
jgi:hypothetical protein